MKNIHPSAAFIYFIAVILVASFSINPGIVVISVMGGLLFYGMLCGNVSKFMSHIAFCAVVWIITMFINVIFSHNGVIIILFVNNKPITMEAFLYGAAMGGMIAAALTWCRCLSIIMTDEKVMCVMGGILPKLALLFSMALRFIPRFRAQIKKVTEAQRAMGLYQEDSVIQKFKSAIKVFSAVVTWSLENAIETGDSMRARGYGKKEKRTSFSIFKFGKRDGMVIAISLALLAATMGAMSKYKFYYYPVVSEIKVSYWSGIMWTAYLILAVMPVILEIGACVKWKFCRSKI